MDLKNLHFPQYFPKNCPPKDAEEKEMTVYRFCRNKHIVEDDFKSYYQKDPNKYCGNILAYGISVFSDLESCYAAKRKMPFFKKQKGCAYGITFKHTGKIKATPSKMLPKHHTWWLYEGVQPHTYFQEIEIKVGDDNA